MNFLFKLVHDRSYEFNFSLGTEVQQNERALPTVRAAQRSAAANLQQAAGHRTYNSQLFNYFMIQDLIDEVSIEVGINCDHEVAGI